jgi:hypothetical protein
VCACAARCGIGVCNLRGAVSEAALMSLTMQVRKMLPRLSSRAAVRSLRATVPSRGLRSFDKPSSSRKAPYTLVLIR